MITALLLSTMGLAQTWTPGTFEIHVLDVGQGDSQLVIFPSGYTILIDLCELNWNSGKGAELVAERIRSITGRDFVDVAVVTHLHLDHLGTAGTGGMWALLEKEGIQVGKLIDRDGGHWQDGSGGGVMDGLCDPKKEVVWENAGTGAKTGTSPAWICYTTDPHNVRIASIRQVAQVGSTTQIRPPDTDAVVTVEAANGWGVMMEDGITPIRGDHTKDPHPPSENDYSIALKVQFGLIDYATAGDTGGEYSMSEDGYTYNDGETALAAAMGPVDILHANHHGSDHSSNQVYLDTLKPEAILVSCGAGNTYGHPGASSFPRLKAAGHVYLTERCDPARDYTGTVPVGGDIVIKSTDGIRFTVHGDAYVATDPWPLPVSSTGLARLSEIVPNPDDGVEWVEVYNPTLGVVDLSGVRVRGSTQRVVTFPAGTMLAPGGYAVLESTALLRNRGGDVFLLGSDGSELDHVAYPNAPRGESWQRATSGGWLGVWQDHPSKGAE